MASITLRSVKGSPLTNAEIDGNFTNLNDDKIEDGDTLNSLTIGDATINGGTISNITDLAIADGGTGSSTAEGARNNLGLTIGTNVQAWDADLDTLAGLTKTAGNFIVGNGTAWEVQSGSAARLSLGLGSIATQAANSVTITGGSIAGITDLAIADGGTGSSTATGARTNLGLGSLATLSSINDSNWSGTSLSVTNGGTGATTAGGARTNLGLGTLATLSSINNSNWSGTALSVSNGGTGSTTLTANAVLIGNGTSAVGSVAPGNSGNVLVSNGSEWISGPAGIGVGQTWQNVTSSRSVAVISAPNLIAGQTYTIVTLGTTNFTLYGALINSVGHVFTATSSGLGTGTARSTYINQTTRPIQVMISNYRVATASYTDFVVGGVVIARTRNVGTNDVGTTSTTSFIVPVGASYTVVNAAVDTWAELR